MTLTVHQYTIVRIDASSRLYCIYLITIDSYKNWALLVSLCQDNGGVCNKWGVAQRIWSKMWELYLQVCHKMMVGCATKGGWHREYEVKWGSFTCKSVIRWQGVAKKIWSKMGELYLQVCHRMMGGAMKGGWHREYELKWGSFTCESVIRWQGVWWRSGGTENMK